ncbi:MAG: N-acetyltransferase [Gammaproteobacteria bacterium]|nr:N-acetyltransferase [Gammaproteobacteria bacterium]
MIGISAIYTHHVLNGTASFEESPPDVAEMRQRYRVIVDAGLPYLVAEKDGRIVGYSYVGPYRTRSAYRYTVEDSVYVDPAQVGNGIGTALITALFEPTRRLGMKQIIAVIGGSTNIASQRLHERQGFVHVGTLTAVGFKFGRWVDSVVMQKALD